MMSNECNRFRHLVIASVGVFSLVQWTFAQPVELDEPEPDPLCNTGVEDVDGECLSGCMSCDSGSCDPQCGKKWAEIKRDKRLQAANNLGWADGKFDLIVYQQTRKGKGKADGFQWNARQWLGGKAPGAVHWAVNKIGTKNDAPGDNTSLLAAIKATYAANGNAPINVVIVGHGAPGLIKVGEDILHKGNITELANVRHMIKRLVLFGCCVAADGKRFVEQLQEYIGAPVKSWTSTVWASTKGLYYEGTGVKNVVPTVSSKGLGALVLVFAAALALKFARRRAHNTPAV